MKRAFDKQEQPEQAELEEGEQEEDYYPLAGPSTFSLQPPPPPPLLRLVVHHSSQNPAADLLPSRQGLALIEDTTTIGRDKSFEPRIRLKTLEVSRTHATIFQEQLDSAGQSHRSESGKPIPYNTSGKWYIVDNASTHGTYLRRHGEEHYTRLSDKGQSSLPRQLKHLDTIKVANQRFIAHLHTAEEGGLCEACTINEDRSNLVPLLGDTQASSSGPNSRSGSQAICHAPMDEKTAKTFTKEEKRQNFRSNMQSLRKNLLSGGTSGEASGKTRARDKSHQVKPSIPSEVENNSEDNGTTSIEPPRYVDRAKLRRSIHPPQHGLSDADPPQGKRSRLSSPSYDSAPRQQTQPSYGPGAALFQKMVNGNALSANSEAAAGSESNLPMAVNAQGRNGRNEVKMGKVIEVRTMAERSAGLGSGTVREGVEQHANSMGWQDAARQRRWRDANR